MNKNTRNRGAGGVAAAVVLAVVLGTSACNPFGNKATEPLQDAPIASRDTSAAEVYNMPDGFSNFASKCDHHGNRVYVAFHHDSPYGAITVVKDPTCG